MGAGENLRENGWAKTAIHSLLRIPDLWRKIGSPTGWIVAVVSWFWNPLSPVLQQQLTRVIPERAEIAILADRQHLRVGDEVNVHIAITPTGMMPRLDGLLVIRVDESNWIARTPLQSVVKGVDSPIIVPDQGSIVLRARKQGALPIDCLLSTKRGSYRATLTIPVAPAGQHGNPTQQNFSGRWDLRFGDHQGELVLYQSGTSIRGMFIVSKDLKGMVEGLKDGDTFKCTLVQAGGASQWSVAANWKVHGDSLEITGKAKPISNSQTLSNPGTQEFYATAPNL